MTYNDAQCTTDLQQCTIHLWPATLQSRQLTRRREIWWWLRCLSVPPTDLCPANALTYRRQRWCVALPVLWISFSAWLPLFAAIRPKLSERMQSKGAETFWENAKQRHQAFWEKTSHSNWCKFIVIVRDTFVAVNCLILLFQNVPLICITISVWASSFLKKEILLLLFIEGL